MKPYREVHVGQGIGQQYDSMHEARVDSLIWRNFVKPFTRQVLQDAAQAGAKRYLDFACGTGRILKVGASVFPDASGIDISSDMLKVARERIPDARFYCTDITADPTVVQGTFDCVTMFRFLLNAEPELRKDTLAWLAAHTKPGATLLTNNHRSTSSIVGALALLRKPDGRREQNVLSRKATIFMLENAGFHVERCVGFRMLPSINGRPILGNKMQLQGERLCQLLGLGRFGAELVFVARRV